MALSPHPMKHPYISECHADKFSTSFLSRVMGVNHICGIFPHCMYHSSSITSGFQKSVAVLCGWDPDCGCVEARPKIAFHCGDWLTAGITSGRQGHWPWHGPHGPLNACGYWIWDLNHIPWPLCCKLPTLQCSVSLFCSTGCYCCSTTDSSGASFP